MSAADPHTDLADRLDEDADWHHTWAQFIAAHDDGSATDAEAFALHDGMSKRARAAAAELRRLARRATCPTCGSDDRNLYRLFDVWEGDPEPCSDPWHREGR